MKMMMVWGVFLAAIAGAILAVAEEWSRLPAHDSRSFVAYSSDPVIAKFCEVGALCNDGSPHWVGWIVFVFISFTVVGVIISIIAALAEDD